MVPQVKRSRADLKQIPPEDRKRREEERQASFRAWWNGLSPEAQRAEIKAGHVRVNLPSGPEKSRKPRKRTREAQRRSAEVEALRQTQGEAYVHMTPLRKMGVRFRAFMEERGVALHGGGEVI